MICKWTEEHTSSTQVWGGVQRKTQRLRPRFLEVEPQTGYWISSEFQMWRLLLQPALKNKVTSAGAYKNFMRVKDWCWCPIFSNIGSLFPSSNSKMKYWLASFCHNSQVTSWPTGSSITDLVSKVYNRIYLIMMPLARATAKCFGGPKHAPLQSYNHYLLISFPSPLPPPHNFIFYKFSSNPFPTHTHASDQQNQPFI